MSATPRKEDRRIVRTRALLRDALLELIIEKGYQDITVQDITDRADVARTTFYLHFTDKDDLLFKSMREIYEELISHVPVPTPEQLASGEYMLGDGSDFKHVAQYAEFYKIMLGEKGSPVFLKRVRQLLAEAYEQQFLVALVPTGVTPRIPLGLLGYMLAGLQLGTITWWVNQDLQGNPDEINVMCERFVHHGLLWALGIANE